MTSTINFARRRKVSVKAYKRKDGTTVKASSRNIKTRKRKEEKVKNLQRTARSLLSVAQAFNTGANAVRTLSEVQLKKQQQGIENNGINTAIRAASAVLPASKSFRNVSVGISTLAGIGNSRQKLKLSRANLAVKRAKLRQDSRRTDIWAEMVRETGRKNSLDAEKFKYRRNRR